MSTVFSCSTNTVFATVFQESARMYGKSANDQRYVTCNLSIMNELNEKIQRHKAITIYTNFHYVDQLLDKALAQKCLFDSMSNPHYWPREFGSKNLLSS